MRSISKKHRDHIARKVYKRDDDSVVGYLTTAMDYLTDAAIKEIRSEKARLAIGASMVGLLLALNRLDHAFDDNWFKQFCLAKKKGFKKHTRSRKVRRKKG